MGDINKHILNGDGTKSADDTINTKLEFETESSRIRKADFKFKMEVSQSNNSHLINESNYNIQRSSTNQSRSEIINTKFNNVTELQTEQSYDSGCFSSQSTNEECYMNIQNTAVDRELKEYTNVNDYDNDSNCSGYHSSDFEFIDENEAKKITFDTNELVHLYINKINFNGDVINKDPDKSEGRRQVSNKLGISESYTNCHSDHVIPEDDDFLTLFKTDSILNFDTCNIFVPGTRHSRVLGLEIDKFDACKKHVNETDEKEAMETENKILSIYPHQNRYYKRF